MPRKKNWIDRAVETGDWKAAEETARRKLQSSSRRIQAARTERPDRDAPEKIFERIDPDAAPEPVDPGDDRVQEYLDDDFKEGTEGPRLNEELPSDEPDEQEEAPTRPAEILGGVHVSNIKGTVARRRIPLRGRLVDHLAAQPFMVQEREQEQEAERFCAEKQKYLEEFRARGLSEKEAFRELFDCQMGQDVAKTAAYREWLGLDLNRPPSLTLEQAEWIVKQCRLYGISEKEAEARLPKVIPGGARRPSAAEHWRYKHRGLLSALERPDGKRLKFGNPPQIGQSRTNPYYGHEPPKMGRPRKPDKLSDAERSRRHRAKKEKLRNA